MCLAYFPVNRIMHEVLSKLLKAADDVSLVSLCQLMTIAGQELEAETKNRLEKGGETAKFLRPIKDYFDDMVEIIQERRTSVRVYFLMVDCVHLHRNRWQQKRRNKNQFCYCRLVAGPDGCSGGCC